MNHTKKTAIKELLIYCIEEAVKPFVSKIQRKQNRLSMEKTDAKQPRFRMGSGEAGRILKVIRVNAEGHSGEYRPEPDRMN